MRTIAAALGPSPNTVWVAGMKRGHPWQPRDAVRSVASERDAGTNGAASYRSAARSSFFETRRAGTTGPPARAEIDSVGGAVVSGYLHDLVVETEDQERRRPLSDEVADRLRLLVPGELERERHHHRRSRCPQPEVGRELRGLGPNRRAAGPCLLPLARFRPEFLR